MPPARRRRSSPLFCPFFLYCVRNPDKNVRFIVLILRLPNTSGTMGSFWRGASCGDGEGGREGGREGGPHFFRVIERTQKPRWRSRLTRSLGVAQ